MRIDEQKNRTPTRSRRVSFRRKQQNTSVFFLLWTVFSVLILGIVLLFSGTQQLLLKRSYAKAAVSEVSDKGGQIRQALQTPPPDSFGNYNGYVNFLTRTHGVEILVLDERGNLLYPQEQTEQPTQPEYEKEAALLKSKLESAQSDSVLYEGEGEYRYGTTVVLFGTTRYLQVSKSMQFIQDVGREMTVRSWLLAGFVFILTFAVSSAVAGWLVNPITELTEKAKRLAKGDFDVNFHGREYGRELVELADTLNFARDELSKTDRMQRELIANVSHDFKTPLTMIKGYASMIQEISGDNREKRNKHAQIIVDEADRLTALVSDVLDLSKIRSGIAQLKLVSLDMSAFVYEVLGRFSDLKDREGYRFTVEVEEGLYALVDEVKIGQVLYNLIGNAVNYTGEDKQVFLSFKREGEYARFSVRDTGMGIAEEELTGIWERYYRSTDSHKRPVKGTGLGLSIVKTVLDKHGFSYGVESKLGKGSTFYVLFPLDNSEKR